jgi:hypothetical protein
MDRYSLNPEMLDRYRGKMNRCRERKISIFQMEESERLEFVLSLAPDLNIDSELLRKIKDATTELCRHEHMEALFRAVEQQVSE